MKKPMTYLLSFALLFCLMPIGLFAQEMEEKIDETEVTPARYGAVADVEVGYRTFRDPYGCPDGNCWNGFEPIYATIYYNNSFRRTGRQSCTVNGDVMVCRYEFNIDGTLTYVY